MVEHDECGGGVAVVGCGGELSHKPGAGEAAEKVQFGSRPNFGQVAAEFVELHFFQAADVFAAHDGFENAWQKVFHVAGSSGFVVQWDAAEVGLQIVFGNVAQGKAQQFALEVCGRAAFAGANRQRETGAAGGEQAVGFFD